MDAVSVHEARNPALAYWLLSYCRREIPYHLSRRWQVSLCQSFYVVNKPCLLLWSKLLLIDDLRCMRQCFGLVSSCQGRAPYTMFVSFFLYMKTLCLAVAILPQQARHRLEPYW